MTGRGLALRLLLVSLTLAWFAEGLRAFPVGERSRIALSLGDTGFGSGNKLPRPSVITPSPSTINTGLEKFLMMYTCKICQVRNAQMISKVAYNHGMVVSTCKKCKSRHLIADNEGKLDMAEYGKKIEDYLVSEKGEKVQRLTVSAGDLEKNYLVDYDGVVSLVSKDAGQLDPGVGTVVEFPSSVNSSVPPPPEEPGNDGGGRGFKTERVL